MNIVNQKRILGVIIMMSALLALYAAPAYAITVDTAGSNKTYSGAISSTNTLVKQGAGILTLSPGASATGGTVTTNGSYTYNTFKAGGTFTPNGLFYADVLVVAGGGGVGGGVPGTTYHAGGGGGDVAYNSAYSISSGSYGVTVGAGGAVSTNGGNSTFGTGITAIHGNTGYTTAHGGASGSGYAGGAWTGSGAGGAGGGGDSGVGSPNSGNSPGNGGAGTSNSISGSAVTYGAGGKGGAATGGDIDGAANTGTGGGGEHGTGGSGIVIVRYINTASNSYTGGTTIAGGTIKFGSGDLGPSGNIAFTGGALMYDTGNTQDVSSRIKNSTGDVEIDTNSNSVSFASVIDSSNIGGLTKTGAGTLTLSQTNTYTGATAISAGTLKLDGSTVAASTVGIGTSGTLTGSGTVNGNATLTGSGIINKASGTIAGTLGVTSGNWNGAGAVTGAVTSSSGTLTIGSSGNLTANGGLNVTGGSIAAGGSSSTITGSVNYTSTTGSTFGGVIAGSGKTLTMNAGSTTLTLSGAAANTYSGTTTVSAGELDLNKTASIDAIAGNVTVGGGTLKWLANNQVKDTGTLTMTTGAVSLNGMTDTVAGFSNSGGTFTTGAGHLIGTGATITWSGGTNTVNNGGLVEDGHIVISGGTNTVEGGATGGVLQLNSGGTGLVMSNGITLTLNSDAAVAGKLLLKGNVSTSGDSTVTIASGGSATNPGTVDLDGGTRTFTVADGSAANDLAISAVITNGGLTKSGAGILILSGANAYSGTTLISNGTLKLSSTGSIAGSTVIDVASGAYFDTSDVTGGFSLADGQRLMGSGTVTGTLTIPDGSILSPGSSPGTQLINGSSVWETGGEYLWEINADTHIDPVGTKGANPGWDWVSITGTPGTLTIQDDFEFHISYLNGFAPTTGDSFIIASATGGITLQNGATPLLKYEGDGLATDWSYSLANANKDFLLTYNGSGPTGVPEPATVVGLGAGILLMLMRTRKHKIPNTKS